MTLSAPASAFQILPKVSDVDRKLANYGNNSFMDRVELYLIGNALPLLKSPVHEAITLAALDCASRPGDEEQCLTLAAITKYRVLLYGVRWPDDPPFALNRDDPPRISNCDVKVTLRSTAQPKCWTQLFLSGSRLAAAAYKKRSGASAFGPGDYLLYRSHYGDLQFMHSMGSYDGELASETIKGMKMWARFLWKVRSQQFPPGTYIRDMGMDDVKAYFPGDITPTNLFATGIVEVRKELDQVALGVLLHMVQDSFSAAHARRAPETGAVCHLADKLSVPKPGRLIRFYSYAHQASHLHDGEDTFDTLRLHTLETSPSVVDVSRAFLQLAKNSAPWETVEKLFDCVFESPSPDYEAGPGPYVNQP